MKNANDYYLFIEKNSFYPLKYLIDRFYLIWIMKNWTSQ